MLAVAEQPASYSEDAVAALWSRAHTLVDTLVTEAGERMRVIYPGRRSSQAGPDFRDAVLITEDGRKVHGDVEIHTSAPRLVQPRTPRGRELQWRRAACGLLPKGTYGHAHAVRN